MKFLQRLQETQLYSVYCYSKSAKKQEEHEVDEIYDILKTQEDLRALRDVTNNDSAVNALGETRLVSVTETGDNSTKEVDEKDTQKALIQSYSKVKHDGSISIKIPSQMSTIADSSVDDSQSELINSASVVNSDIINESVDQEIIQEFKSYPNSDFDRYDESKSLFDRCMSPASSNSNVSMSNVSDPMTLLFQIMLTGTMPLSNSQLDKLKTLYGEKSYLPKMKGMAISPTNRDVVATMFGRDEKKRLAWNKKEVESMHILEKQSYWCNGKCNGTWR